MVINLLTDLTINVIHALEKTKGQIQNDNYKILEKEIDNFFKKEGYLLPEKKKKYVLENGLIIKNRRQFIKRTYKCEKILAYDIETYKGIAKLICCSGSKFILDTKKKPLTFLKAIKFLFSYADNPNTYRFFYNIDFDFSAILKLWKSNIKVLQNRILRKISWLKNGIEVKFHSYSLKNTNKRTTYIIKWIKGKMLTIRHESRRKSVIFTDIFTFFSTGLNKSAKLYLNDLKIDNIDGNLLNTSLDYWKEKEKDIIKYCIQDCILTERLGKLLIDTVEKNGLPLPKFLVSSASLSKQFFRLNCFIPSIWNVPKKILQISYDSYFGGRFEMFKRGYFERLYHYDINSQYPDFIKDLPNLRDGLWKKSLEIPEYDDNKKSTEQCLGYFLAEVNIPMEYKIPTIPIHHKGINKFPCGKIKKWMTWYDLDLIRKFIVKIYDGYIFFPTHRNYKPFIKEINELFEKKQKLKGKSNLDYTIVKLCMNAFYGCFIEVHKNYDINGNYELNSGILFNSVYASQITAFGRWSVLKDIPKHKYNNIIAIHTDSITSDIPLDKYLTLNLDIGKWNKENKDKDKGIILNTGMYQIGYIIKTRGIPKKSIINWLRFCLKNQSVNKREFKISHMRKLSEGLIRDKSLENVNTIVDDIRTVNCNSDTKRDWISDFKNFNEVITTNIDSYPLYCFDNYIDIHPNPICVANRFENF
jgi:hypothetical protein